MRLRPATALLLLFLGAVTTLIFAWVLPALALASADRPVQFRWETWEQPIAIRGEGPAPQIRFGESWLIDWYQATRAGSDPGTWPSRRLFDAATLLAAGSVSDRGRLERRVPGGVALPVDELDAARWVRIDTQASGFPFRAFASETWYPDGSGRPEVRHGVVIAEDGNKAALVPTRPLAAGLVGNLLLWTLLWTMAWWAFGSLPATLRAWRGTEVRSRGRCASCGALASSAATKTLLCRDCAARSADPAAQASDPPHMSALGTNPDLGTDRSSLSAAAVQPLAMASPPMRYQSAYVWLIFFSSLDIMLTWAILRRGGSEVNPVADAVIVLWGLNGAIAFKFALMLFVIIACEIVGRRRDRTGRWLARVAVAIAASPVIWSFALLVDHILVRPTAG